MIPATQSRVRRLQRLQRLHTRENVTFAYEAASLKVTWKPANDPDALDLLEKVVPVANVSAHEKQQRIAHALDELRNEKVGLPGGRKRSCCGVGKQLRAAEKDSGRCKGQGQRLPA